MVEPVARLGVTADCEARTQQEEKRRQDDCQHQREQRKNRGLSRSQAISQTTGQRPRERCVAHVCISTCKTTRNVSLPLRRALPQRSLPPCGGGTGRGVTANAESAATPLPTPPP